MKRSDSQCRRLIRFLIDPLFLHDQLFHRPKIAGAEFIKIHAACNMLRIPIDIVHARGTHVGDERGDFASEHIENFQRHK